MFRKEGRETGFSSKISDKREPLCTVGPAVQLMIPGVLGRLSLQDPLL